MRSPDFFIVGAPKCGTTSLYHYLQLHPDVYMAEEKEPHFFATDMPKHRRMTTEAEYLDLFRNAPDGCRVIGEASTWYLTSGNALQEIRKFNPDAKIAVCFRNPVDFVQSLHAQFAFNGGRRPDFPKAWERAKAGGPLKTAALFGRQYQRLIDIFPENQVLVILQDDLREDPRKEYLRTLNFLGLPDDGRMDFSIHNANKTHRSQYLAKFAKNTPEPVDRAWRALKKTIGIKRLGLLDSLRRLNVKPVERVKIDPELRARVADCFSDDIALLSRLLQRDLSHWR